MIWDILMAVAALAAVTISLVALLLSRRDARNSAASAERSAGAAAEAAEALERSAIVAERAEAAREPAWRLTKSGPVTWDLMNVGAANAYDLELSVTGVVQDHSGAHPSLLRPQEVTRVTLQIEMWQPHPVLVVQWSAAPGATQRREEVGLRVEL